MDKFIDLRKLNNDELYRLRKKIVGLKEKGYSGKEIERLANVRANRVSEIWQKYKKDGPEALKLSAPGRKQGEKALLTGVTEMEIRRTLTEITPDELGMPYSLWTRQIACDYIRQKYGIRLSFRCMTNYFKKWGFICRAPAKTAEFRTSPAFKRFMEKDFPVIVRRAASENVGIYWFNETCVEKERGGEIKMAAAVTARGTSRFTFFEGRMSQEKLIVLMSRLIRFADRKVFFIAADTEAFRGKKVREWLKGLENRIEVFYYPNAQK